MRLARGERDGERFARSKQVSLPDHFVDRSRPEAIGERRRRVVGSEEVGHRE
jgi:hypothetical protein